MAGIAVPLSLVLAILFRIEHISVVNLHLMRFLLECAVPIGGVAAYCHWAKYSRLRDGCLIVLWACIFFNLLQLPQYAAARTGLTLRDALFMHLDGALRIDGAAVVAFVHRHPVFEAFSIRSYGLMPYLVFAAILIPAATGKLSRSKEFLLATTIASIAGSCALAILPAAGPWVGYHFHPYWNQAWYIHELNALRSAAPFAANPDYTCGLITFPSFHIALATLSVFALWPFRWVRPVALFVAMLIAVATVTTGWHYICDGIAGLLLALASISAAKKLINALAGASRAFCGTQSIGWQAARSARRLYTASRWLE